MAKDKVILGIDPGTNIMGYGLVLQNGKKFSFIHMDSINLSKIETPALKLKKIFEATQEIIQKYQPEVLAIEAPFYGKNVQSLIKLGRAQGVAIAAGITMDIPVFEYLPLRIKQSITGNGRASKEQVCSMLFQLMKIKDQPSTLDASDALAVAVCHALQGENTGGGENRYNGWESFLAKNQKRIISN